MTIGGGARDDPGGAVGNAGKDAVMSVPCDTMDDEQAEEMRGGHEVQEL